MRSSIKGSRGLLTGPSLGSRLARVLLPACVAIPVLTTLLQVEGVQAGLFDAQRGAAVGAGINALAFATMIAWVSWVLNHADSHRVEREAALAASEKHLRSMYDAPLFAIASWNSQGQLVRANDAFLSTLGYTRGELEARELSWNRLSPPEETGLREEMSRIMYEQGRVGPFERQLIRADGTRVPVLYGSVQLDPAPEGVTFILDISELKEAREELLVRNAQLEQANAELDSFSYSVSHDLRAPLRAMAGFSKALEEDYAAQLDDDARHYLARIRAGTLRMAQLIDDLLQLARITRSELHTGEVDLSALASLVAEQLREHEPERSVEWRIEPGLKAVGDGRLLRIVLENLLGNAWKFTAKQPDARIEFGAVDGGEGRPAFFVRDNGAGFDMQYADKLFGAFQRLHSTEEYPGTGIGLATVRRVIQRHQGEISAVSAPGEGATFTFTLGT
jgi:PAS domain S-box-containing protein